MSDLGNYFRAQAETEAARQLYNYAGVKLELCKIKERLAEIESQHEPISAVLKYGGNISHRDMIIRVAEYVVIGRMPE